MQTPHLFKKYQQLDAALSENIDNLQVAHFFGQPMHSNPVISIIDAALSENIDNLQVVHFFGQPMHSNPVISITMSKIVQGCLVRVVNKTNPVISITISQTCQGVIDTSHHPKNIDNLIQHHAKFCQIDSALYQIPTTYRQL